MSPRGNDAVHAAGAELSQARRNCRPDRGSDYRRGLREPYLEANKARRRRHHRARGSVQLIARPRRQLWANCFKAKALALARSGYFYGLPPLEFELSFEESFDGAREWLDQPSTKEELERLCQESRAKHKAA